MLRMCIEKDVSVLTMTKGPHTRSNSLRNTSCCADNLIMCGVVWLFVQQFDDFHIGLNFVTQQFEGCMDMFASCCTTSPVHHWFSYRSHLLFKMSHTTANKEFWREFIQLYRSLPEFWKVKSDAYKKPQFEGWTSLKTTKNERRRWERYGAQENKWAF
jgi:hypothetical protein